MNDSISSMPPIQTIRANGMEFAYYEPGQGPLVRVLHGFPDTALCWRHVEPRLAAAGFRAVAPFLRGYEPTVLRNVSPDMRVSREEIFGPVAPLIRFTHEAEAIAMANDTEFGLAAYFYTRDLARSWRVMEALDYGIVGINAGLVTTEVAPFGGMKESGHGREGSRHGVLDYTEIKYACVGGIT